MQWLWTWGGTSFGYRDDDALWTHDGRNVGRFQGDEVFGTDGRYLGELRGDRLITNRAKKTRRGASFVPPAGRVGYVNRVDYIGNVMLVGYEDFPTPGDFR